MSTLRRWARLAVNRRVSDLVTASEPSRRALTASSSTTQPTVSRTARIAPTV